MDQEFVTGFIENVLFTRDELKKAGGIKDADVLKTSISLVDQYYRDRGVASLINRKTSDWELELEKACIPGMTGKGPDIYMYTCYPKGDPNDSNTAGFTEYQLSEFAKSHRGLTVYLNHEKDLGPVGITVEGGVGPKGQLMGGLVLYNTPLGKLTHFLIEKYGLRNVSLGAYHSAQMIDGVTHQTHAVPHELSLCFLGDQPGTVMHGKVSWEDRNKGESAKLITWEGSPLQT